jgi:hypothetical protein
MNIIETVISALEDASFTEKAAALDALVNAVIEDSEYDTVSVNLTGLVSTIKSVSASSLTGTVDINSFIQDSGNGELADGTYSVDVDWNLPDGVKIANTVSVYVKIEKKE